ncbi:hypothetical protein ACQP2T_46985 [Nonomuraea sp. CA-143628]|uniref:hypothetical protein n=1 Tax=Nonomuraea sp. CA-143628 TaxID=3239997 RepID=UPI003D8B5C0D
MTDPASNRPAILVSSWGSAAIDISQYILLTIETGVQSAAAAGCDGFATDRVAFQGTLGQLVSSSSSWATGAHGAPLVSPDLTKSLRYTWTTNPAMLGSTQDGSIIDVAFVYAGQSS